MVWDYQKPFQNEVNYLAKYILSIKKNQKNHKSRKLVINMAYKGMVLWSLCRLSKNRVKKLDWFKQITWLSLQEFEQQPNHIHYNKKELRTELHLITAKGDAVKGFYAIRKIMLRCPLLVLPGMICYLPYVELIGNRVYRWVAKSRHFFLKKPCDDGKCGL